MISGHALVYTAPQVAEVQDFASAMPGADDLRVRMLWSGLSRGTERLVFQGRIPASEHERMRAPFQVGDFPFPVRYGYCAVGMVEAGPETLLGRAVFSLHPHQTVITAPADAFTLLPAALPPRRGVLAANMETALNSVWDGGVGPGDRVAIVGGGILGGLIAGLCGQIAGVEVTLVDSNPARAALADHMNVSFAMPANAPTECDVVFHTSATGQGAQTALAAAGVEARVVEVSWYGDAMPALPLGGAFHSKRLQLISSQVGMVSASRRARWTYRRRMAKALELLTDDRFDALITTEIAFTDLPAALPALLAPEAEGLATAIRY